MTPKEKALELFNKFIPILGGINSTDWIYFNGKEAKQCAIIAVDEIMRHPSELMYDIVWFQFRQTNPLNWLDTEPYESVRMNALKYWQEVKTEIEKL
jgi:hypothetical protein